jgi:hypothetical protein
MLAERKRTAKRMVLVMVFICTPIQNSLQLFKAILYGVQVA